MEFYEKTVNYFKFFADVKLIEPDYMNSKIAIVFYGKENLIHIFDMDTFTQYYPLSKVEDNVIEEAELPTNFHTQNKLNKYSL